VLRFMRYRAANFLNQSFFGEGHGNTTIVDCHPKPELSESCRRVLR
jgi:hypothetical protein